MTTTNPTLFQVTGTWIVQSDRGQKLFSDGNLAAEFYHQLKTKNEKNGKQSNS